MVVFKSQALQQKNTLPPKITHMSNQFQVLKKKTIIKQEILDNKVQNSKA